MLGIVHASRVCHVGSAISDPIKMSRPKITSSTPIIYLPLLFFAQIAVSGIVHVAKQIIAPRSLLEKFLLNRL